MRKLRVGVIFGGRSGEHEISLRSAQTVLSALDPARYEAVPIGIARDGRWYLRTDARKMLANSTTKPPSIESGGTPISLRPHPDAAGDSSRNHGGAQQLTTIAAESPINSRIDVAFPVLHGTYGEDGTIQGLLELAGIPYVGAGVLGSAIGMDKDAQKRLLREAGIPVVEFRAVTRNDYRKRPAHAKELAAQLGYPVFVKPNALGSSIGTSKVRSPDQLAAALEDAFQYDRKALIEAACIGHEFECAVLGNDEPEASVPGEVIVKPGYDFYSYESKYLDPEGSVTQIPADVPQYVSDRIRALSIAAFKTLELRGMARVDFFTSRDFSAIFVNEVNTIPGFTSISMYPKMWEASGLPLPKLIERLIELALEEHRERAALKFTYRPKLEHAVPVRPAPKPKAGAKGLAPLAQKLRAR
jgi:D-alanine-D-alanine ligase